MQKKPQLPIAFVAPLLVGLALAFLGMRWELPWKGSQPSGTLAQDPVDFLWRSSLAGMDTALSHFESAVEQGQMDEAEIRLRQARLLYRQVEFIWASAYPHQSARLQALTDRSLTAREVAGQSGEWRQMLNDLALGLAPFSDSALVAALSLEKRRLETSPPEAGEYRAAQRGMAFAVQGRFAQRPLPQTPDWSARSKVALSAW